MDQPRALCQAEAAVREPATAAGTDVWESDLADLAGMPLTAVDRLAPLPPSARLLGEVLRARESIRGGGEGTARAE
ncbi:hypothetical protein [Streptomyces violarus]|uniref:hypothetical protein n=1 Tax=Streptomyces violarus TaxID=67380 RepID=UPI000AA97F7A|nr:hypothetical protein [Streptomyces violarus]MCT9145576.1 hypothetical protein [Streptomyces violarus]